MDEGLDDCLVGACGSQGVHSGEVWPHEGGPETDGQVFTGHQVHPAQLAHPGKNTHIYSFSSYGAVKTDGCLPPEDQQSRESGFKKQTGETYLCKWLTTYLKAS